MENNIKSYQATPRGTVLEQLMDSRIPKTEREHVAVQEIEELIRILKLVYQKHHLGDEKIGWDELDDILGDTLAEIMGDDEFQKWIRNV